MGLRLHRSCGNNTNNAAYVNESGALNSNGNNVNNTNIAVRPASPQRNTPETRLQVEPSVHLRQRNRTPIPADGQRKRPHGG